MQKSRGFIFIILGILLVGFVVIYSVRNTDENKIRNRADEASKTIESRLRKDLRVSEYSETPVYWQRWSKIPVGYKIAFDFDFPSGQDYSIPTKLEVSDNKFDDGILLKGKDIPEFWSTGQDGGRFPVEYFFQKSFLRVDDPTWKGEGEPKAICVFDEESDLSSLSFLDYLHPRRYATWRHSSYFTRWFFDERTPQEVKQSTSRYRQHHLNFVDAIQPLFPKSRSTLSSEKFVEKSDLITDDGAVPTKIGDYVKCESMTHYKEYPCYCLPEE